MSRAKRRDLISNTNIFQRDTWSVQTLVNLFLETGGPGVVLLVLGGNPLSPNFSKTAWNIQTPFYRMDTDNLRMVYINFHNPICPRDFSGGGGEGLAGRYCLSLNYFWTAWNFQTPLSLIVLYLVIFYFYCYGNKINVPNCK